MKNLIKTNFSWFPRETTARDIWRRVNLLKSQQKRIDFIMMKMSKKGNALSRWTFGVLSVEVDNSRPSVLHSRKTRSQNINLDKLLVVSFFDARLEYNILHHGSRSLWLYANITNLDRLFIKLSFPIGTNISHLTIIRLKSSFCLGMSEHFLNVAFYFKLEISFDVLLLE